VIKKIKKKNIKKVKSSLEVWEGMGPMQWSGSAVTVRESKEKLEEQRELFIFW
jgi:hypothetical protein